MLRDLLNTHHAELLHACAEKMATRHELDAPIIGEQAVTLFLTQLAECLLDNAHPAGSRPPSEPAITHTATLLGAELLRLGYPADQVVHHYGDVCQAITELAAGRNSSITADEFRILHRCIDQAIADALSAFAAERETAILDQATDLHLRLGAWADEQKRLLDLALAAAAAMQTDAMAARGANASLLKHTLTQLRDLTERSLPEIRLKTGLTESPRLNIGRRIGAERG